ncbi:tetratricopeptide repeat protein [Chitinophaga skermanii]|uniref:Tetratricopeptide repeat protein n=1 Tax=Chitinophaga skermanii TaxID=331697 RepID=A0A327R3S5_9BACT|nr:tetratricopeptide repeat protein [Chitinophaga skermanii]RAJ10612.1 tetratricopeptide repeat protein [Chitinophaga skermanii]
MRIAITVISFVALALAAGCKSNRSITHAPTQAPLQQVKDPEVLAQRADSLFFAAQRSKMLGDYKTAITQYSDYLRLNRYNPTVYYELARLFVEVRNAPIALSFARVSVKMDNQNKWFQRTLADAFVLNEMYDSAATVFDQLARENADNEEFLFNKAMNLAQANKPREALNVLDTLEKKMGVVEDVILQKQRLLLRLNNVGGAAAEIKKLIADNPLELRYRLLLADVYEANNYPEEAKEQYNWVLKRDEFNPRALIALANMEKNEGNTEAYWTHLSRAFANPDYNIDDKVAFVYPYLQMLSLDSTKMNEGLRLSRIIVDTHPTDAKAFALQGDMFTQAQMEDSALTAYFKAVDLDSTKFTVWYQIMWLTSRGDDVDMMKEVSEKVTRLFPKEFMGYYFNGLANYFEQHYGDAAKILNRGLQVGTGDSKLRGDVYSLLGDIYHATGQHQLSDSCYELVLDLRPKDHLVMNNYSYYLSMRGEKLDKAERLSRRSLDLMPNSPVYLDTYAWILFRLGKYSEARDYIEKALTHEEAKQDPDVLEHYGDILYNLKEVDKAVEYWQLAKSKGANSVGLAQKIAEKRYIHPAITTSAQ